MKVKDKKMSFGKQEETTVEATTAMVVIIHSNEVAPPPSPICTDDLMTWSPLLTFYMFGTNKLVAHNRPSRVPYTLT
jgi:hypothetical protein